MGLFFYFMLFVGHLPLRLVRVALGTRRPNEFLQLAHQLAAA